MKNTIIISLVLILLGAVITIATVYKEEALEFLGASLTDATIGQILVVAVILIIYNWALPRNS